MSSFRQTGNFVSVSIVLMFVIASVDYHTSRTHPWFYLSGIAVLIYAAGRSSNRWRESWIDLGR
jgi:cell division protein FtsW (lipid II flippase)